MKQSEEEWIDKVMTSYDGKKTLAPSPDVWHRVQAAVISSDDRIRVSKRSWMAAAALALVVLSCNILALSRYDSSAGQDLASDASTLFITYDLYQYD